MKKGVRRKARALFFVLALSLSALSRAELPQPPSFEFGGLGYSAIPFAGYDDKSGWLYGGAGFIYRDTEPEVNAGLFGVSNGDNFHSATLNYEQRTHGRWVYVFHGLAERAFDNYYGEGDLTSPNNPRRMGLYHFEVRPSLLYALRRHIRLGVFDDYRSRLETGVERLDAPVPGDPLRVFPSESSNSFGVRAEWDTRDSILSSRAGDFVQLNVSVQPQSWTTLEGATGFSQLTLDARNFRKLHPNLVLASRFQGAASFGEPGYLFRFRLGGLDALRGYKDNRFRGRNFATVQEELRWFIKKWLSVNLGADLGAIGDAEFHQAKLSAIAGLRIGLPPDYGQKLRVELGYGYDQQTFQIQFGEIF